METFHRSRIGECNYCSGVAQNSNSGIAVIVARPHAPRQLAEPCTEAQTEAIAVVEAVNMARALIRSGTAPLLWMRTDALGAIQGLLGSARGGLDSVSHAQLQSAWQSIEYAATLVHITCTCTDPVYHQVLVHAKQACRSEHTMRETFFLDGTHGYRTAPSCASSVCVYSQRGGGGAVVA